MVVNNPPASAGDRRCKRLSFSLWAETISWSRKWQPTPVILTGQSHGQRSLADNNPWGHRELDTTERLRTHKNRQARPKNKTKLF